MTARSERIERFDRRPLKDVKTDDYEIKGRFSCSAAVDVLFEPLVSRTAHCRPGQSLGQAIVSIINNKRFKSFAIALHWQNCQQSDPETHVVYMDVVVLYRPTPTEFESRFEVLRPRK